jgi:hypothetical protein
MRRAIIKVVILEIRMKLLYHIQDIQAVSFAG